jgi:hypothetical protein
MRLKGAFGVFAVFIFGMLLGDRRFSYLHVSALSLPVYVTEIVMVILFVLVGRSILASLPLLSRAEVISWSVFYFFALQSAIRGFGGYSLSAVLRDSALIYYSFFYFLVREIVQTPRQLILLGFTSALALVIRMPFFFLQLIDKSTWVSQPAALSMYLSCFVLVAFTLSPTIKKMWVLQAVLVGVGLLLIILFQVRTAWVGLGAAVLVLIGTGYRALDRRHIAFLAVMLLTVVISLVIWEKTFSIQQTTSLSQEFKSLGQVVEQPNAILHELVEKPTVPSSAPAEESKPLIQTEGSLGSVRTRLISNILELIAA